MIYGKDAGTIFVDDLHQDVGKEASLRQIEELVCWIRTQPIVFPTQRYLEELRLHNIERFAGHRVGQKGSL